MSFSPDEIERLLVAQGVPRDKVKGLGGIGVRVDPSVPRNTVRVELHGAPVAEFILSPWPVRLTLPWSCLISDNAKCHVLNGKLVKTADYRMARSRIAALATEVMGSAQPAEIPLSFVARVYVPTNHRRDVHNFGKCALDSMSKIIFADDHLLHDVRWIRAGIDIDRPRADITIEPL